MVNRRFMLAVSIAAILAATPSAGIHAAALSEAQVPSGSAERSAAMDSHIDSRVDAGFVRPRVARDQRRPQTNVQCWGCFTWHRCGPDNTCWTDFSNRACGINRGECNIKCATQVGCNTQ